LVRETCSMSGRAVESSVSWLNRQWVISLQKE
jgi:hypothetical protein